MDKPRVYAQLRTDILAVLEGEPNVTAKMATVACLLAQAFPDNIWSGFYVVDPAHPEEVVVGPYQGTLGCLRIPFGRGVCGVAAASGATQVVENVHDFAGHIACDSRSVSEIVVPVRDGDGRLIGVLDIDHPVAGRFDEVDRTALEPLMAEVFGGAGDE